MAEAEPADHDEGGNQDRSPPGDRVNHDQDPLRDSDPDGNPNSVRPEPAAESVRSVLQYRPAVLHRSTVPSGCSQPGPAARLQRRTCGTGSREVLKEPVDDLSGPGHVGAKCA